MAKAVLVVDDEPLNNGGDARRAGCEVLTAATGSEARTTIAQELHIAILITDINMPGMGGYELADRATRVRNGLQVILLSGRESAGHGFPLIRKPFFGSRSQAGYDRDHWALLGIRRPYGWKFCRFYKEYRTAYCCKILPLAMGYRAFPTVSAMTAPRVPRGLFPSTVESRVV
jgi:two-component system, cell cycle response regulator CpdR